MTKYKVETKQNNNRIVSKFYRSNFGFYFIDKGIKDYPLLKRIEKFQRKEIEEGEVKTLKTIID